MFTQPAISIIGATPAGASPTGSVVAFSSHAPIAREHELSVPALDLTQLNDDDLEDLDDLRDLNGGLGRSTSGEAIWQEVVRMLVAREAAKAMHPARGSRISAA
jgi:hypothetical protein